MFIILNSNLWRTTSEEKRAEDRARENDFNDVRRAAEVHRQVKYLSYILLYFKKVHIYIK